MPPAPLSLGVRLARACLCWLVASVERIASARIASVGSASRSRIHAECRGRGVRANLQWPHKIKSIGACGNSHLVAPSTLTNRSSGRASGTPLSSGVRPNMQTSSSEQRIRRLRHWELWVGFLACGLCGGLGSYIGSTYFGHSVIFAGAGGGVGGLLFGAAIRYVDRRYYQNQA